MKSTSETFIGRDAKHEISVIAEPLQSSDRENGLKEWRPETGAARQNQGFASAAHALKWVKTMLGKVGWPNATQWQICPATVNPAPWEKDQTPRNVFRVYLVDEQKKETSKTSKTDRVISNLRSIVALCENPHFSADRKYRIAELALEAIKTLSNR